MNVRDIYKKANTYLHMTKKYSPIGNKMDNAKTNFVECSGIEDPEKELRGRRRPRRIQYYGIHGKVADKIRLSIMLNDAKK